MCPSKTTNVIPRLTSFLLLVFFGTVCGYAQTVIDIVWDDPIAVSVEAQDNNRPRIALTQEGNPIVLWGQDSGNQLHLARWVAPGFESVSGFLPAGIEAFTSVWAGPELDANGGVVAVVFKRYPEDVNGAYYIQSLDGGLTWSDTLQVDFALGSGFQSRFPSVALDSSGEAAVSLMTFEGNYLDPTYEVAMGSDGNAVFSELQNTSTAFFDGEACDCCMAEMLHQGDDVIQLYRNNIGNIREIRAVRSSDNGSEFDQSFECDQTQTYSNVCFSSGPSGVFWNNMLLTAFRANVEDGVRAYVSLNDLDSGVLEQSVPIDADVASNVSQNNVKSATNGVFLATAWEEIRTTSTNVLLALGTSVGGLTSAHDTVNVVHQGRQINPDIAMDDTHIHMVWQDNELDVVMYRRGFLPVTFQVGSEERNSMILYPNPCANYLTIEGLQLNEEYASMFSVLGKEMKCNVLQTSVNSVSIDTSGLTAGVWVLVNPNTGQAFRFVHQ